MSRRIRLFQVDAFTARPFAGNPVAVLLDAELLLEEEFAAIARELSGGDTAFVLPPDAADHDLRVRFFTPRAETGFIGHATLAAHAVLSSLGHPPCHRQKQRGGIVAIQQLAGAPGPQYAFSLPAPTAPLALPAERLAELLAALGIGAADLDPRCPPVVGGAGGGRGLIALRDGALLARLQPDLARLAQLSAAGSPTGFFVYTLAPSVADCETEARMFCPAIGIAEDPVSGNTHAMLGAYLYALGLLGAHRGGMEFRARQGHHLGRPGFLQVTVDATAGAVNHVRVAGAAAIVYSSTIELPARASTGSAR